MKKLSSQSPEKSAGSKGKLSAHHRGGTTESMEDYLECIAEIVAAQGFVRVTDVAEQLDIRRASVSVMIKRLAELGHLNHIKYRGFTLTANGAKIAAQVRARHETLTEFFTELGLSEASLQKDVEGIEHHISSETLQQLRQFLEFWKSHASLTSDYAKFLKSKSAKSAKSHS